MQGILDSERAKDDTPQIKVIATAVGELLDWLVGGVMFRKRGPDSEPVGEIYARLRSSLMRYASRYFRRPQEIEDIVQEAFVKVIEAESAREIHITDAYLFRATRNLSLNLLDKADTRLTDTLGDLLPQTVLLESPSLEDEFELRERFELFCRAVRQLPVKCRRVFILRRVYGLSHKEIAERMGISVKTVEVHLTRAIVCCTDYMDADQNELSCAQVKSVAPAKRKA